ncbi:MAG: hypothetical protein SGJ02_02695 [bacterium]|nr:hypothetical protein [bacterium]
MADSIKIVDIIITNILEGKSDKAEKLFLDKVFNIKELTHYAYLQQDFKDYLGKYSYLHFGNNEGYIEDFDAYDSFNSDRNIIEVIFDAHKNIIKKTIIMR